MSKLQKYKEVLKSESIFFIILLITISSLFVLLAPKISSQLFSFKREMILNNFLTSTIKNGKIDSREYWKFREFYSPGYFNLSKTGISTTLLNNAKQTIGIKYRENAIDLTFLFFTSPRVKSLDMLTKKSNLNELYDKSLIKKDKLIFKGNNNLIYKSSPKDIKIIFFANNSEMKKANGFFENNEEDEKISKGENWFNITSVNLD